MSNIESLTLLDPVWDTRQWPRFADYKISGELLIPVGRPVERYDATQAGKLAGELVATGYDYPRDPTAILPFTRKYGLLTATAVSADGPADLLEQWSKIRRHAEIALLHLRHRKQTLNMAEDALWHVNQGLRECLSIGVSRLPGRDYKYEFGYRHFGLAGVIFERLAQVFAGVVAFKVCKNPACNLPFIVGRGWRVGRKQDAVYCSKNCKVYHWRILNPKPKRTTRRTTRSKQPVVRKGGLRHSPR
jgi:hypothetical protein